MKNLGELMKKAQAMQAKMAEIQAQLAEVEVEGVAGGGMVLVILNGKGELKRLNLDPTLLVPDDVEMLEDLIVAAHTDAKAKQEARMAAEMPALTDGLPLPPGIKLF